jgi:hypothetical protein
MRHLQMLGIVLLCGFGCTPILFAQAHSPTGSAVSVLTRQNDNQHTGQNLQ